MEKKIIFKAEPADAEGIVHTLRESWIAAYTNPAAGISKEKIEAIYANLSERIQSWNDGLETKERIAWVAKLEGKVVGFVSPRVDEKGRNRLGALYLRPEAFGKDIGHKLLEDVIKHYRGAPIYLDVVSYNKRAKRFYEKHGFQYTGEHSSLYMERGDFTLPLEEMVYRAKDEK